MRIVLVPRWGGDGSSDWYPWLRAQLPEVKVDTVDLRPTPDAPEIAPCVAEVQAGLAEPAELVVGHSVGNQAVLRCLADHGVEVPALICVAGWFAVDQPWDTLRPWQDTPIDFAAARARTGSVDVLLGEGDPFTSDLEANAAAWRERLDAEVHPVPGAKHFNRAEEPEVLASIRRRLGIA